MSSSHKSNFNNKDMVKIDCFYYTFYIKKNELKNYNLTEEEVVNTTETVIKRNSGEQIKKFKNKISNVLEKFSIDFSNEFDSFSHILTIYNNKNVRVLEKQSTYKNNKRDKCNILNDLLRLNLNKRKNNIVMY